MPTETKPQHTPGQWFLDYARMRDGSLSIMDEGPECPCIIASVHPNTHDGGQTDHQHANALLIAAAPKLLAALQATVREMELHHAKDCRCQVCLDIRAAIATATE